MDKVVEEQQMDKVVEEYRDIFASPKGVPMHCQVKHSIHLTPCVSLPYGPTYQHSIMEKWYQEIDWGTIAKRAHRANLITLWEPDCIGIEEGWDLEAVYWLPGIEQYHFLK